MTKSFLILLLLMAHFGLCRLADGVHLKISSASHAAYNKYLEDTCQKRTSDNHEEDYLTWEQHEFIVSLRKTLLPETSDGDLEAFARSDLINYLPTTRIIDPHKMCKNKKGGVKSKKQKMDDYAETKANFGDDIFNRLLTVCGMVEGQCDR